jgi:hypothetical protein
MAGTRSRPSKSGLEWRELVRISMGLLHQFKGNNRTPWLICWLNSAITTNSLARIGRIFNWQGVIEAAPPLPSRIETGIPRDDVNGPQIAFPELISHMTSWPSSVAM